jgi:hypothetical protein
VADRGLEPLTSCMPCKRSLPQKQRFPAFSTFHRLRESQEFSRFTGILLQLLNSGHRALSRRNSPKAATFSARKASNFVRCWRMKTSIRRQPGAGLTVSVSSRISSSPLSNRADAYPRPTISPSLTSASSLKKRCPRVSSANLGVFSGTMTGTSAEAVALPLL